MLSSRKKQKCKLLDKCLSRAQTVDDIIPLLKHIDFSKVKLFVREQLYNTIQNVYSCLAITDVLHENVIQHILSFTDTTTTSIVCKTFNTLCNNTIINTKKKFLQENHFDSNDIDQAYQLTIKYLLIQEKENKLKMAEKSFQSLKRLVRQVKKQKLDLQVQMHDIRKPIRYLARSINYENEEIKLPPFTTKYIAGYNKQIPVYSSENWISKPKNERLSQHIEDDFSELLLGEEVDRIRIKSGDKIIFTPGVYDDYTYISNVIKSHYAIGINGKQDIYLIGKNNFNFQCDFDPGFDPKSLIDVDEINNAMQNQRSVIVGGDDVEAHMFKILSFSNAYFENLTIDDTKHDKHFYGTILVSKDSGIWMKNCIINTNRIGINIGENGRCYVKNCTFIGGSIGITIDTMASEVLITDCTFTNCGNKTRYDNRGDNGAIVIHHGKEAKKRAIKSNHPHDDSDDSSLDSELTLTARSCTRRNMRNMHRDLDDKKKYHVSKLLDIRIVNNTFTNNYCHPIVFKCFRHYATKDIQLVFSNVLQKCQIEKNKLSGFNCITKDPNIIYQLDDTN